MAIYKNTSPIVTNGLVFYVDALNPGSISKDPTVNLLLWSQDFSQSVWNKGGSTVTSNTALAPDGTNTACLIDDTNASSTPGVTTQAFVATAPYLSVSFYTKKDTAPTRTFLIRNQTTSTDISSIGFNYSSTGSLSGGWFSESYPNGWFKLSNTITSSISSGNNMLFYWGRTAAAASGSTNTWYMWGAQIESNYFPSDYIISTNVKGVRNTWNDLSGNNYIGLLTTSSINTNIPTYYYPNQRILNFDGTSSYVVSDITQSNSFTYNIWFRRLQSNREQHLIEFSNTQFYVGSNNRLGTSNWIPAPFSGSTTIQNNQWYNAVLTRDSGSGITSIYLNGQLENTTSSLGTNPSGNKIFIGQFFNLSSTGYVLSGSVAQASLYNRALSQQEVLQNYNALKSRFNLT